MNITAVARRAGVSIATVSRVINGSNKVSPGTAELVQEAITALNFYPNTNARALGSGRSSLYGLIISDITNPFFPELVKAFEDIAVAHGQEVLIANTDYDSERMEHCVTRMLQRKVDGVAIMTSEIDDHLVEVFSRRRVPLVFLDAEEVPSGVGSIHVDYPAGVALAVDHLTELGHACFGFISGPLTLHSASVRRDAFLAAMQRHQLAYDPSHIEIGNHRIDGGYSAMLRLLDREVAFTAVLCSNDLTAIGAMRAIHERGLRIPEDISVVGYDDILISAHTWPALTTLGISRAEIADCAFRRLYESRDADAAVMAAAREQAQHVIHPALVVRDSTGPAPAPTHPSLARLGTDPVLLGDCG